MVASGRGWPARTSHKEETLCAARLEVLDLHTPSSTPDGHFPAQVDRDYEERLVALCAAGDLSPALWESRGPRCFMAGLAVMLASHPGYDRRSLLALAEQLHPGASEVAVFADWLERSPLRPWHFLPLLDARLKHTA